MTKKKMTKAELKNELQTIANTIEFDLLMFEEMLIDNEIYSESEQDERIQLDRSGRAVALRTHDDLRHIARTIWEVIHKM